MYDEAGNSLETTGGTDWLGGLTQLATTAAEVYKSATAPAPTAAGPVPVKPGLTAGAGFGGVNPWLLVGGALALLAGLVLLLRRN